MRHAAVEPRRSWWAANRWWLVLLPVVIVAAAAASSYRVKTFWWDGVPRHQIASAGQGNWLRVHESFSDPVGRSSRTYRVRLTAVTTATSIPTALADVDVPAGVTAYRVHLSFVADPATDMNACSVVLLDDHGDQFGNNPSGRILQANLCVPEDHPGPATPFTPKDRRGVVAPGEDRPTSWSVDPMVLAPSSARIRTVRIVFGLTTRYVTLRLPAGS